MFDILATWLDAIISKKVSRCLTQMFSLDNSGRFRLFVCHECMQCVSLCACAKVLQVRQGQSPTC